jgi:oligopeptidase B
MVFLDKILALILPIFIVTSCKPYNEEKEMTTPPVAEKIKYSFNIHGQEIVDEYAWLRDPNWPKVEDKKILNYLREENKYFEQFFVPLSAEKEQLFEELKGRIKLTDQSVPVKKDEYFYYSRTLEDKDYPVYCRKYGNMDAKEEILLDVNELAKGEKFTKLGAFSISPDHKLLAYSVDFSGDERYIIKLYDLEARKYLQDVINDTIGSIVWHEQISGFFYTPANENWRHDKVMFHKLGEDIKNDKLILHESDLLYQVGVSKSSSRKYIFIDVGGAATNETYVIDMEDNSFSPKLLKAKADTFHYDVEHEGDYFYIHTNHGAKNYRIARISIKDFEKQEWVDYIPEDKDSYLDSFDISSNYLILNYKENAIPKIKIVNLQDKKTNTVKFPETVYVAGAYSTNFEENDIRVSYSSLGRPDTVYSYNFSADKLTILKVREIPSGFNPEEYVVERAWADNDGVKIPLSIFYKKSLFKKDGTNPLFLYGYGSYGISMTPGFSSVAISLANRGFVYVISHIRGGEELGQEWYEAAKFLTKKRTFEDFIKSAEYLINEKYTKAGNIIIEGGSAGGLLVGAVINERPELFKAAIAHVPFVDMLNTMLDEDLPLTPGEFKEWGNPKEIEYFEYIKSYSPYDNIKAQNYPILMVTAGISDPRVGYWEAAKWVAKLKSTKTDGNLIIFKTNLDAGHAGSSGRFDYLKETAEDLVFTFKIFDSRF